ncbi:hypothetical protein GIB67_026632 [Kingdonia uniflora]|uniref:Uncharacterized protein n=1 Tax=Kingdonia uniflora TaxID=39325 RepID=A0A7J7NIE3_9MAGN|nr:hypothetical protein GIB67_026632 [Kingdonia uniflora]
METFHMLENSNVIKDGFRTSVGGVGEDALEIEARVVTEESKKFNGNGLEMKHYEETMKREVHRAIDLVDEKDVDVLKSFGSKSHEEVAILMREVYMISDSNCQETQPKKPNPNPKPLTIIQRTIGEGMITSPTTEGGSPVTRGTKGTGMSLYSQDKEGRGLDTTQGVQGTGQGASSMSQGIPSKGRGTGQSAAGTRKVATGIGQGMPSSASGVQPQPLVPTKDTGHKGTNKKGGVDP